MLEEIIKKKQQQRKERWATLKQKAPETAAFIGHVTELFGKPSSLTVQYKGEKKEKWK